MTEEEIIDVFNTVFIANKFDGIFSSNYIIIEAMQGLLDLYKTQKEELEYYKQKEKDEFEERDRWE